MLQHRLKKIIYTGKRCISVIARFRYDRLGFTLIELLITLAVLAILAGIAVPVISHLRGSSRSDAAAAELSYVQDAVTNMMVSMDLDTLSNPVGNATSDMSAFPDPSYPLYGSRKYIRQATTLYSYYCDADGTVYQNTSSLPSSPVSIYTNEYSVIFDGSNEIVQGPATNAIIGENVQHMTMSCWVKTTNSAAQYVMSLKRGIPSSHSTLFTLGVNNPASQVYLLTWNGSTHTYLNSTGKSVNNGGWHHICAVIDGSARTLYLDGGLVASDSSGIANVNGNTDNFTVGGFAVGYGSGLFFGGNIDEVSIWTKSFESGEVTELYNSGTPSNLAGHSEWSDCVLWWKMGDDDTYPTLSDNKGSKDGTMTNMESGDIEKDTP